MIDKKFEKLLKSCEDEKLHLSGMIQAFGSLLVIEEKNHTITHVAENIYDFLELKIDELLGKDFKSVLPNCLAILNSLDENENLEHPYIYQRVKEKNLYLKISKTNNQYIIDIQKISNNEIEFEKKNHNYQLYVTPDTRIGFEDYIDLYMDTVFSIIDFDRIMLYQFKDDWSGKVINERKKSEELGSYLNLRFPASDIPKIARDLYMINPSRSIADVEAENIDIISLDSTVPDLTYSETRSVSPMHIEYLKNMGVKSSFSIAIIVSGELWGLLACHNFKQKRLDPLTINNAVENTKLFSLGTQNFLAKEKINNYDLIEHRVNDIVDIILSSSDIEQAILKQKENFLELIESDGFALVINDRVIAFGTLPDQNSFIEIDSNFMENTSLKLVSNCISNELFIEENYLGPAGVLGVKQKFSDNFVRAYWFRSEFIQELHWAGNPNKPKQENADALILSPRRSFEKFIEIKRSYCKNFSNLDTSTALKLSNTLFRYLSKDI